MTICKDAKDMCNKLYKDYEAMTDKEKDEFVWYLIDKYSDFVILQKRIQSLYCKSCNDGLLLDTNYFKKEE